MPQSNVAVSTEAPSAPPVIQTRFGEMVVDPASVLRLPRGILGFANEHDYALASLPAERFGSFKLLQSLTTADLSFIVAPYETADGLIAEADLDEAFRALDIASGDRAVLLVVSVRKTGEKVSVSVNLRAPIVVDMKSRTAWQYVLSNPEYSVRHAL